MLKALLTTLALLAPAPVLAGDATATVAATPCCYHVTVDQLRRPPMTTCMVAKGWPAEPFGSTVRKTWSSAKRAAYHDAFWGCIDAMLVAQN